MVMKSEKTPERLKFEEDGTALTLKLLELIRREVTDDTNAGSYLAVGALFAAVGRIIDIAYPGKREVLLDEHVDWIRRYLRCSEAIDNTIDKLKADTGAGPKERKP